MTIIQEALDTLTPQLILLLVLGVSVGIIGGALPGVSSTTTVALVATFVYTMETIPAILFLAATQVGSTYGGSISATVLNIPGTPASAATAIEGFPLAKRGDGQLALAINATSSFLGNTIGVILLVIFFPFILKLALNFGSWEMFWFSVFGLVICVQLSRGEFIKGLISACLGLVFSFVGMDQIYGVGAMRFTYGIRYLRDGIKLVPAMVGLYGMAEVLTSIIDYNAKPLEMRRSKFFAFKECFQNFWLVLKSTVIGFFVGVVPGVGANIASWVGYNAAVSSASPEEKKEFGKGSIKGLIGSEASNNACVPGAYAPLLSLGVPGDGVTAIVLGVLTVQGVQTGPQFMSKNPEFIYLVGFAMLLAGLLFLFIGTFLGKGVIRMLTAPLPIIMATVACLCAIGSYTTSHAYNDIYIMFFFGVLGVIMRKAKFPIAPLILGIVVGGKLVDANFRRAVLAGKGSFAPFFTRPISLCLVIVLVLLLFMQFAWPVIKPKLDARFGKNKKKPDQP